MKVACIGECMVELSEQPDGSLARGFGGDTLNTALYLARLGVAVDYVTALGDDVWSDEMAAAWGSRGDRPRPKVRRLPGRMPGLYIIRTDPAGERSFHYWRDRAAARDLFTEPGAAETRAALETYDLVYLSGISLSLYGPRPAARPSFETLSALRARGGRVAFDTNYRPRGWPVWEVGAGRVPGGPGAGRPDLRLRGGSGLAVRRGGRGCGAAPPRPGRDRAQDLGSASGPPSGCCTGTSDSVGAGRSGRPGRRHDGCGRQLRGGLSRRPPRRAGPGGGRGRGSSPRRGRDRASRRRDSPGRDAADLDPWQPGPRA